MTEEQRVFYEIGFCRGLLAGGLGCMVVLILVFGALK